MAPSRRMLKLRSLGAWRPPHKDDYEPHSLSHPRLTTRTKSMSAGGHDKARCSEVCTIFVRDRRPKSGSIA